ncbi:MAG TPA: hypothetical protein VJO15_09360 [Dehalococcoidia bacterium]|nr:hypothetical protein [Dehalococcoidia bacterium]
MQTRFRLNVPVGVPPGDYSLAAVVYAPVTLQPVAVFDSNQKSLGATLPMGRVRVDRGKLSTSTASVTPSHPEVREVAPGVRLLGYDMPAGEVDQGGILTLMLYWQALSQPQDDYQVSIRLTGGAGNVIQDFSEKPHHGLYPTTEWRQGEIVRDVHLVPIPGDASPGTTRVTVALTSPGVSDPQGVELAAVVVKERLRTFEIPAVENPREVDLGGKVRFLGYALSGGPAFRPGGEIDLNLYWQAKANNIGNYAVFTHLLDDHHRIWAQHDGLPVNGTEPTPGWVAGQTVVDKHQLAIKADAPPGEYVVEIGMYDPTTGQRLKTPDGEDRILLDRVRIQ